MYEKIKIVYMMINPHYADFTTIVNVCKKLEIAEIFVLEVLNSSKNTL